MLTVAVGWELYERTHSALSLGLVGLTNMAPMFLFTLPAGHLADNLNRQRIIVSMTAVIALAGAGLTLASALHAPTEWTYACLFVAATARTFMWPASSAFLPQLVSRRVFPRAVTWATGSFQLSSVAGPAAGGALIAVTGHAADVVQRRDLMWLRVFLLPRGRLFYEPCLDNLKVFGRESVEVGWTGSA